MVIRSETGSRAARAAFGTGTRAGDLCATGSIPRPEPGNSQAHFKAAEILQGWFRSQASCITRKELTCQGNWVQGFLDKIAAIGMQ